MQDTCEIKIIYQWVATMHWSYVFLALTHRYHLAMVPNY